MTRSVWKSQLSPSVLLSEQTQEGCSYAVRKEKRESKTPNKVVYSYTAVMVPQVSGTFNRAEALYFCLF